MKIILKYFFLAGFYFWGVVLDVDKYISLGRCVLFGRSSQIRVGLDLGKYGISEVHRQ